MRASYSWLRALTGVDAPPADVARRLVELGFEVESTTTRGEGLAEIVVARVLESGLHPKRAELSLVRVDDGAAQLTVVCGARTIPPAGALVALARVGALLPGRTEPLAARRIAGVESPGMLCSEIELDAGTDGDGLIVVPEGASPGQPVADALSLRDSVFDIAVTPNRPDALGHIGLAREVAHGFGRRFDAAEPEAPSRVATTMPAIVPGPGELVQLLRRDRHAESPIVDGERDITRLARVIVEDRDRCPRYGACAVVDVRVGPSPFWLRYRLHSLGIRPISNVVDVTNLILLEYGHPIHAFDLDRLRDQTIVVRLARDAETMKTLDGVERTLTRDDLLICDGRGPVAVAGVMGGIESEISADTRRVLVECAFFDPRSVRRTSRRLGLHTEASHRFERGVDIGQIPDVLAHTAALLTRLCHGAAVPGLLDVEAAGPPRRPRIPLRVARAERVLGFPVQPEHVEQVLDGIGCAREPQGDDRRSWVVQPPTWRVDLAIEDDLVEEIARVRGFHLVPLAVPPVQASGTARPELALQRRLREAASAAGLDEAMHHALVARRDVVGASLGFEPIAILNPVSEERGVLRPSLLPSLAGALRNARRRQVERVRLFELGRVFRARAVGATLLRGETDADRPLPEQPLAFAFILAGAREGWMTRTPPVDFYDGKGIAAAVLGALFGAQIVDTARDDALPAEARFLHPRRSARVVAAGDPVGVVGELHPDVVDALELGGPAVYGELDVERLLGLAAHVGDPQVSALPRFPHAVRDLAVIVDEATTAASVKDVVRAEAGELLESVEPFDLYRGASIPAGRKSLAFRLVFRAPDRTLTDDEVDRAHARLVEAVTQRAGGALRT